MMTRGSHIVAIDGGTDNSVSSEPLEQAYTAEADYPAADTGDEDMVIPRRSPASLAVLAVLVLAFIGWTAAFVAVNWHAMATTSDPALWVNWIRDYSPPVLLLGMAWLLLMRNSRREADRFGDAARLLREESTRLEQRLKTVNQELSLARQFIESQARDLETLGRVATERLSHNADHLANLVRDNGVRIDAISSVSAAALDNMEKLRGQLPVIASSAKDVTNNIAAAGHTAHTQLEQMVSGFNRLNEFGQASERQVGALRATVDATLGEFTRQADQLGTIATQRFTALTEQGEQFRNRLDQQEIEALSAIRTRAAALSAELDATREQLNQHEAESLTSLRARLGAIRDESGAISRAIREGEVTALESWRSAITELENQLHTAIAHIAEVDAKALETARKRLDELAREAEDADLRLAERDRLFAEEMERRRDEIISQGEAFAQRIAAQLADMDAAMAARRTEQQAITSQLADHSATVASQLDSFVAQMGQAAAHAEAIQLGTAGTLAALTGKLAESQTVLAGADSAIAKLTEDSVRLLELVQASLTHSRQDLPAAMASSEAQLEQIEARATQVQQLVQASEGHGNALNQHLAHGNALVTKAIVEVEALHAAIGDHVVRNGEDVVTLAKAVAQLREESGALADHAQGELKSAIAQLSAATRLAVAEIEQMSAASVTALADRIGQESAEAIEVAMRARAEEVAGKLELAADRAAGVSREAAVHLRDQLAKVNELAGHLERRVAHARHQAEEQVNNDFARRVALITESLNSNAIDIARAMASDVSDSAWAAYLRGDRGVFTRRAVKLLDSSEAKSIVQLYESDHDFREHVSRYIHDFEGMLRQLLSTRDGHAMGVTMLSSDMGKLYVALAQAIERLRK